jgi:hypothetical protein
MPPEEEPTPEPTATPEPIPSATFYSEHPEANKKDELYHQIIDQSIYLKDMAKIYLNISNDIIQKNEAIIEEKKDSPLPADQEEVQKARERLTQTQTLIIQLTNWESKLPLFIEPLINQCPKKSFEVAGSLYTAYFAGTKQTYPVELKKFKTPRTSVQIVHAYFRPNPESQNPYKHDLVIQGRFINANSASMSELIFNNPKNVIEFQENHQYTSILDYPKYLFRYPGYIDNLPFDFYYNMGSGGMYMSREGGGLSEESFFSLIIKDYRFKSEFLQQNGINQNDTQNKRLFSGIPLILDLVENVRREEQNDYIKEYRPSNLYIINPLGLNVLDIPEGEEVVYLDGAALFSPRDQNVQFDRLAIPLDVPPGSGWNMKLFAQDDLDGEPFWQTSGTGPQQVVWDGFSEENCVPENKYVLRASDSQGNVISEQTLAVDSTPPLVKELDIQVNVLQTEPEEVVETTVKFQLFDPLIKGVAAGLNLEKWQLQIDVDDAPLFATPLRDPDGFWVASALPQNQITVESVDPRTAKVEFKLPYRLDGRMVKVRARDRVGNQVWQLIQSQGGLF